MLTSVFSRSLVGKLLVVVIGCSLLASTASAGMITSVQMFGTEAGTGPGMGTVAVPIILTPDVNNANQTGGGALDNNFIVPIKTFDNAGNIDIVFHVTPTNGVTEYKFFESVDNNTGTNWSGYIMELGFGTGGSFTATTPGSGLNFDFPTFDTPPVSTAFSTVIPGENTLLFTNGIQGTASQTYQFRVDVPNSPDGSNRGYSFTLRETPIPVPEPSACLLLLGGLTCLGAYRKYRA